MEEGGGWGGNSEWHLYEYFSQKSYKNDYIHIAK